MWLFEINIYNALIWTFIAWHYALKCGYISDDHAVIEGRKDIIPDEEVNPPKENYWVKVFNDGIVMYYLNAIMFKLKTQYTPFIWHMLCVAIHLINVYLLYLVLTPFMGERVAVVVVFLWGINPMLNQNIVWISGRPYAIGFMLILIGMLFWRNPFIFIPLYGLAVITNISIGLAPFLLKMFYPHAWQPMLYIAWLIFVGGPFILWKYNRRFTRSLVLDRENFRFTRRRFNVLARTFGYYLWALLVPIRMGWYHQAGFQYNKKWEKFNVWTLVSYALVIGLARCGVFGWWFLLGIIPNANIFATNSFLADRYVYFASVGIWALIGQKVAPYGDLVLVLGTFYVVRAYMYSRHLRDDENMYRENWRNHPHSDYAINNLSYFLIKQRKYDEARIFIFQGLQINQRNKLLWYNLGITWAATADIRTTEGKLRCLRAIDCWKMALQIEPRWKKPMEDLQKMTKYLMDHKVITVHKKDAAKGLPPAVEIPVLGVKKDVPS